ncbi:MAG: PAS domain S-box protein [Vicinamibacteria bacterium]|nr:PAS domain S-box protein [Vicinamibacteria bacterium]
MRVRLERLTHLTPLTIALLYVLVGILWAFFSDRLLFTLVSNPHLQLALYTFKGWGFIFLTAALLYAAIRRSQTVARRAKNTLAENEERLRLALEGSNEGLWEWRPENDHLYASGRNLTLLGYDQDEFTVTPEIWGALIHPEDRVRVQRTLSRLRDGRLQAFRVEYRARAKDGGYRWLLCRGKVTDQTRAGVPRRVLGTQVDITSRRLMEAELRESEERFRALIEASPDMVFLLDREERVLYVNAASARTFGLLPEQMVGMKQGDIFPPGTASRQSAAIQSLFRGGGGVCSEMEKVVARQTLWIETFLVPVKGRDGEVISVLGVSRDITERRRAEAALREAYRKTAEILETISDGFFTLDGAMTIRAFNKAAERMLGCSSEEAVGRPLLEVFPALRESVFEQKIRRALDARETVLFEAELDRPPFEDWFDVRVFPMREGISVFFGVTTERKRLESRLAQIQRVEAVGRLAGGIAHDFNNQLAAILGYNELLAGDLPESHPGWKRIVQIRKAAERAAMLTRQLLAFGRRQVLEPAVLDLNLVVTELSDMLRRMAGEDVEIVMSLAPELRCVRVDRAQLEQALVSMAANARDAMPEGGRLVIETRNVALDEPYCRRHVDVAPGRYVLLTISDTGCGMDETTLQHVFEPFYTTKQAGRSTGLGLSLTYGFVTQSKGHMTVESKHGHGSRFFIYLPQVAGMAPVGAADESGPPGRPSPATVLVVEDEEIVRRLIVEVLEEAGYTVLSADNGAEAVRIAETHSGALDLLVTDVFMPQMGGRQLAARLRQMRPGIGVLFISGYPKDSIQAAGALEPEIQLLHKPFVPTDLVRRVRETLKRR